MALQAASSGTINFNYGVPTFFNGLSLYCVTLKYFNRGSGYGTRTDIFRNDATLNVQERQSPNSMSLCGANWRTAITNFQDIAQDIPAGWSTITFNQTTTTNLTTRINGSSLNWTTGSANLVNSVNSLYYLGKGDASSECAYSAGIAEIAVWNQALTTNEITSLELGFSPRLVRPQALVFCDRAINQGQDIKGQLLPVATTGLSAFPHPRIYG